MAAHSRKHGETPVGLLAPVNGPYNPAIRRFCEIVGKTGTELAYIPVKPNYCAPVDLVIDETALSDLIDCLLQAPLISPSSSLVVLLARFDTGPFLFLRQFDAWSQHSIAGQQRSLCEHTK
jgi:hypothetical protein